MAVGAGLDRGRAEKLLWGDGGLAEVRAAEERARSLGQGVPFFIINGEVALSGTKEVSAFLEAFNWAGGVEESACQAGAGVESTC